MKNTPRSPPTRAITVIEISEGLSITPSFAHMKSAGIVKIAPAASDSPAEPMVCTILLSRMESLRMMILMIVIEITAAGIEAETVSPTFSPRYAFAAPKTTASTIPRMIDAGVISVVTLSAGIYGLNGFSMKLSPHSYNTSIVSHNQSPHLPRSPRFRLI